MEAPWDRINYSLLASGTPECRGQPPIIALLYLFYRLPLRLLPRLRSVPLRPARPVYQSNPPLFRSFIQYREGEQTRQAKRVYPVLPHFTHRSERAWKRRRREEAVQGRGSRVARASREPSLSDGRPIRRVLGRKNTVPGKPLKSRAPADETGTGKAQPIQQVRYGGGSREGQFPQESAYGPLFQGFRPMTDPVI